MKRTLRLRREDLAEITPAELIEVRGASTPFVTDGHHCHGSTLCVTVSADGKCFTLGAC